MPKRISDVSLHVYATPEILDQVVDTVRAVVDDHLQERDVFAWRFTLPVDTDDPAHRLLETQWLLDHPGEQPDGRGTYEIALSLVGAPTDLTAAGLAALEDRLMLETSCGCFDLDVPRTITTQRRDSYDYEFEREIL
ncbi:hypothetical protein IU443_27430 [Nocardia farcinica]|uniref:Uncharacterized protein n=2 Tax=Nocardia farcinica TaxID=37329 RepID=Q5YYM8_NOCFA|nr:MULTISPECIES: hypothetical protein [Nocardia]MBA4856002.1 hypothetical protein [Nocardia farcinica]MBC9818623.1 hypothetical protein [Nocardia farcinica]MBF6071237.1 hypothetical protein [Nocardia farcinica]MBF6142516.1 hypothetical protein [Nocardia farcinica]MBF6188137.1 hypothetical protein [Nocardia farcinica]